MRRSIVLALLACGVLAAAGGANAATWTVAAGQLTPAPRGVPKSTFLDQFYPSRLVVKAGDSVTFTSATFHTVSYFPKTPPPPLFLPDPAKGSYTGIMDAAGQSFFFNGLPKFVYNPLAFGPVGGKVVDGSAPVSTGGFGPTGPKQKSASVTYSFPKAGSYTLICTIHPGMKLSVRVTAPTAKAAETPTQEKARELSEMAAAFAKAKPLAATPVPPNTVYAGVGGSATLLAFLPQTLKVKVGTTVSFVNRSPTEVHNEAFGPQKWVESFMEKTDLMPQGPGKPNQVSPVLPYGTEPKGQYSYDGTQHGNGFFVTPLTAGGPPVPLPRTQKVTFTKPGTYHYFCTIHGPDMSGTVIVTQ